MVSRLACFVVNIRRFVWITFLSGQMLLISKKMYVKLSMELLNWSILFMCSICLVFMSNEKTDKNHAWFWYVIQNTYGCHICFHWALILMRVTNLAISYWLWTYELLMYFRRVIMTTLYRWWQNNDIKKTAQSSRWTCCCQFCGTTGHHSNNMTCSKHP